MTRKFLNEINQDVTQRERATEEHERLTRSRLNAIKQKEKIEEKIKKMVQDLEHQNEVITACQARLLLGAGRRPSQGFASVFCYSGPEGARVKVSPLFFVICIFRVPNFLRGYTA